MESCNQRAAAATVAMDYDFFAPPQIVFGWGRRARSWRLWRHRSAGAHLSLAGPRAGAKRRAGGIAANLASSGVEAVACGHHFPRAGSSRCRCARGDCDKHGAGQAIWSSASAAVRRSIWPKPRRHGHQSRKRHGGRLSGRRGTRLKITMPPLPMLAMPTTAGTGSEATKNAVISSYDPPFKKSLRSDQMVPRMVLSIRNFPSSMPPEATAHTGMDAITQLIESYISRRAKPIPRALCIQGLQLAIPALPIAVETEPIAPHARRWPMQRCSRESHWPIPAWAWPTAWRPRWAPSAAFATDWPAP